MVFVTLASVLSVYGATTQSPNFVPTFHKGFSAGLRSAPTTCVTAILAGVNDPDFSRKAREECESRNQRKNFCVDYCVNRAERERRAAKSLSLAEVPKGACNTPPKKVFGSKEDCLKFRLKHCTVNCKRGRDQTHCSNDALVSCVRMAKDLFRPQFQSKKYN